MEDQAHDDQAREKKRAQFSGTAAKKPRSSLILGLVALALVSLAVYLVVSGSGDRPSSTSVAVTQQPPEQSTGIADSRDIRIALAELSAGKARFFDYTLPGNKPVRFFAIKSSDGVYRAALDACDVCYHARKGYKQEGDEMVCNNCGQRFPSALINEVRGGCNPIGLPRAVEGDSLVIKASELEKRGGYF